MQPTITRSEALSASVFHVNGDCKHNWRRNGQTQTWKRSPERFRIPVKFGLYQYAQITNLDAYNWHAAGERCNG